MICQMINTYQSKLNILSHIITSHSIYQYILSILVIITLYDIFKKKKFHAYFIFQLKALKQELIKENKY